MKKQKLTEEEKKKLKEEKKQKRLKEKEISKQINKRTKSTNIVSIVVYSILGLLIINNFIMYYNESYALFYITNISNKFIGLMFYIGSFIPYSSFVVTILIIGSLIGALIYQMIVVNSKKKTIEQKNKIVNILNKAGDIVLLFIFTFLIVNCYYLHLPNLDTLYFEETKNKTYTKDDLIKLDKYLADKVLDYSDTVKRKDKKVYYDGDINKQVVKDLNNLGESFPILKGTYPPRSFDFNDTLKSVFGSNVYGLTHLYSTYFDYSKDKVIVFNTIAHEFSHTKGLVRENETVFLSCLSGIKSDEVVSNYAGYLEAFSRVNYALGDIDQEVADDIEDDVASKCLFNGYDELCNLYVKNSEDYISGSKDIYVSSYYLKNYVDYKDELRESLENLMKIDGKLYLDGKETSIDKIMEEVKEDSKSRIRYTAKIDKKKYNKIKDAFKNDKLYISIYQENKIVDESEKKDDIEKFYLAPFEDYDYPILNSTVSSIDYTYERSARLFLEYFEREGYK